MDAQPPTPRRWFRYSLRAFLAFVGLAAIVLAWVAKERRQSADERKVAERLQAEGVFLTAFGGPYDSLDLMKQGKPQGWARDFARSILGERILMVYQQTPQRTDPSTIAGLENVRELSFVPSEHLDLTVLSKYRELESLQIHSYYTLELAPIAKLDQLKQLTLVFGPGTDLDLAPLSGLHGLKTLQICCFSKVDLKPLAALDKLQELSLMLATYPAVDHSPIERLGRLTTLQLSITAITSEQLESLQKSLPSCKITFQ